MEIKVFQKEDNVFKGQRQKRYKNFQGIAKSLLWLERVMAHKLEEILTVIQGFTHHGGNHFIL